MSWVLLTILAVNFWAIANNIDKYVITKRIKNPLFIMGIQSVPLLIFSLGMIFIFNLTAPNLFYGLGAVVVGALHFFAILLYFKAIQLDEVSRIVPLFSTAVIFTLALATLLLQEVFTAEKYLGIISVMIGSFLISYKHHKKKRKFSKGVAFIIASAFFYALVWTLTKYLTFSMNSISVFAFEEIGIALAAFIPFFTARREMLKFYSENRKILILVFVGLALGLSGYFVFVSAIAQGPVSLVNALAETQYLFVLFYATLISIFKPQIFREEVKGSIISLKILSIILILAGAYLISV